MTNGRPLRFLAVVLLGWTSLRVVALWPTDAVADAVANVGELVGGVAEAAPAAMVRLARPPRPIRTQIVPPAVKWAQPRSDVAAVVTRAAPATAATTPPDTAAAAADPIIPPPVAPPALAAPPRRWAVSAWAIARGGSDAALLGGQLGASQAGLRATYTIDRRRRLALSARIAAPFAGRGREAAFGLDWQPSPVPIHVIAEQRISLDGGRSGPALLVVGGVDPTRIAGPLDIEAYAQAGAVARGRAEPFADAAARVTLPLVARGGWRIDAGTGGWGGAQRGAARVDVGPTIGVVMPVAGRRLRMTADWRQRVAGRARPGSGPALSIGTDF